MMGAKGNLMVDGAVVQALPWGGTLGHQPWQHRRKLRVTAEVPLAVAKAHAEMVGEPCSVVREKPRGPRGGRGAMHYIHKPNMAYGQIESWWPSAWAHRKGDRFYIVLEVVQPSHVEVVEDQAQANALAAAYGAGTATIARTTVSLAELKP
jgi:hypothetical protein